MDSTIAFFAGLFLSWPTLIILFIFATLAEHNNSRGWAIFWTLIVIPIAYLFFKPSGYSMLMYSLGYMAIGVSWSFFRYKRFLVDKSEEIRNSTLYTTLEEKRQYIKSLHPSKNLDTITAWIIVWPFSAIENFVGDLIDLTHALITKVFKGIYYKIYESTFKDLLD